MFLEEFENKIIEKKYSVIEAVWIAAALMAMEIYDEHRVNTIEYYYFKQAEIVKRAQTLTNDTVDAARVSWWCCADAKKHIYNYLRGDKGKERRLTSPKEFTEKTVPEHLDENDILQMNGRDIYMHELLLFVNEQYATIIINEQTSLHRKNLLSELNRKLITAAHESVKKSRNHHNKVEYAKNMILYGPPGTGKTYYTAIYAVAIADNRNFEEVEAEAKVDYQQILERYNELKQEGRIVFTTFHQSYGYEEFMEGIKPIVDEAKNEIGYKMEDGIFKAFCKVAEISQFEKNYVFIIDEINRGNISKIFGELITLIEETKRKGASEELSVVLPYSSKPFCVPNNVYILGTMNTADRSIALIDTALRRRFQFVEMEPKPQVLCDMDVNIVEDDGQTLDVAKMLDIINKRIEYLYDREHKIGHAFFTKLKDDDSVKCLADIFKTSVVPLLQEYFYEDYEKIQFILGDNDKEECLKFIKDTPIENDIFNGYASDIPALPERKYEIQKSAFFNIQSYKKIHKSL